LENRKEVQCNFVDRKIPRNKQPAQNLLQKLGNLLHQLLYHSIPERFGLEGTLQTTWFQAPALGRDCLHQPRVLKAPSSPALNTARAGALKRAAV